MSFISILFLAVGLAMDAFAVATVSGSRIRCLSFGPCFRLSFHFGLFQFLMPVIGWFAGRQVADAVASWDHWIAFGLLAVIGIRMIYEGVTKNPKTEQLEDPSRKWSLVMLSIATSIDALAAGFGLALLGVNIWYPSLIIGVTASVFTLIGMFFGRILGIRFGRVMAVSGGIVLITIGLNILFVHLTAPVFATGAVLRQISCLLASL